VVAGYLGSLGIMNTLPLMAALVIAAAVPPQDKVEAAYAAQVAILVYPKELVQRSELFCSSQFPDLAATFSQARLSWLQRGEKQLAKLQEQIDDRRKTYSDPVKLERQSWEALEQTLSRYRSGDENEQRAICEELIRFLQSDEFFGPIEKVLK
jgi:hypothetical protein